MTARQRAVGRPTVLPPAFVMGLRYHTVCLSEFDVVGQFNALSVREIRTGLQTLVLDPPVTIDPGDRIRVYDHSVVVAHLSGAVTVRDGRRA